MATPFPRQKGLPVLKLKEALCKFADRFEEIPWGAIGLYTYLDKIKVGLQQLMAGARKWNLKLLSRDDLIALSERAAKVTGIPLPEEASRILENLL